MQTMFYYLLIHPDSMNRLLAELEEAHVPKNVRWPIPKWEQVQRSSYLGACLMEALRLHPPFSLPFERVVPAGGITICGQYLPPGTVVGMNPYVVNQHRSTFGEDSARWKPERWIGLKPEERRKLERNVLTV
jgi:cytochrome P450